jgi:hypothetical protein
MVIYPHYQSVLILIVHKYFLIDFDLKIQLLLEMNFFYFDEIHFRIHDEVQQIHYNNIVH